MTGKKVFVTVGTTSFDKLIGTITSESVVLELLAKGFTKIVLQTGSGKNAPSELPDAMESLVEIECFSFKPSLQDDIKSADLIISHAGAGSVMEALEAKKPLLVVINEELMDNHQTELAQQLYKDGHLFYCNCRSLKMSLHDLDLSTLKPYIPGNPMKLVNYLNKAMNYV